MKCIFLTFSFPLNKAGLFYSTHNRIIHTIPFLSKYTIYNIQFYDSWLLKILKSIIGIPYVKKGSKSFYFENLKYENIWLRRRLFSAVTSWGRFEPLRFHKLFCNEFYMSNYRIKILLKKAKDFDYISSHWGYPNGSLAMKISKIIKKPYFVTYHGSDINTIPNKNIVFKQIMTNVIQSASANFMVSEALLKKQKKLVRNSQSVVSYNGINKELIRINCVKKNKIIFIGNLNDDKRADAIPEIIKKIYSKTNIKISFTIIGTGKYEKFIKKQLSNIKYNVNFLNQIPNNEVINNLLDSKILILPSRREGLPLVILEAIASKTIPVAANVGGLSEILEDEFLVNNSVNFIDDFADRVVHFLKNNNLPTLNINDFRWENILKEEMKIITKHVR
tara:strand:- start:3086 stop:4258 length:1173 start_codon:yes stop_codon:yes gene_type:complete